MKLCAGRALDGPELWTSDDPAEREEAKLICDRCHESPSCLRGALERGEKWGVWAGMWLGPAEIRMADPDEPQAHVRPAVYAPAHGTRNRYAAGCRCVPCEAANTAYVTQRRQINAFNPPPPPKPPACEPQSMFDEITAVTTSAKVMA